MSSSIKRGLPSVIGFILGLTITPPVHGNAAHIGSGYRPKIYTSQLAASTPTHPVHVIAFDYRGYGLSTGTPTEEGLISDALTVINYLTSPPLSISPSRIAIVGQSLGTAVAAGVTERYAQADKLTAHPETFASVILFASFSNLPKLLESYSFFGILPPLLSPLVQYPKIQKYFVDHVIDKWDTAGRVSRLTGLKTSDDVGGSVAAQHLNLMVIHAADDHEIPWREGRRVWEAATGGQNAHQYGTYARESNSDDGITEVEVWQRETEKKGIKRVRWERVRYGGK